MHGLDIIITRNAEAAGREAAHAKSDENHTLASDIIHASSEQTQRIANTLGREVAEVEVDAWIRGWQRGRSDG